MAGSTIKGRKVVVVGANPSGVALVKFLIRRQAIAKLVDARAREVVEPLLAESLDLSKFELVCGEVSAKSFEGAQTVLVTPGYPLDSKDLDAARTSGIQVMSELEFVSDYIEEPLIAVAGTNGKSTTANLIAKMFEADGKSAYCNVQEPLAGYLNKSKPADVVVVATSSFQLEGIQQFNPKVVVFLNLSEDHLNRYPNYETYLAANREVLKNVSEETLLVYNSADAQVSAFCQQLPAKKITFSSQALADGVDGASYTKTHLFVNVGKHKRSFNLTNFRLRGPHNRENLMAAAIVATHFGIKQESIFHVIDNVTALPHRVEFVKRVNNVAFYNDACGANPQAVIRTLQAFHEPVILISGGRDKNAEYAPISSHIRQRVKNLILAGEAKEKMNRALGDFTETFLVGTLEEAVILAYQKSRSGEVILFSPAADATDQFPSHEARGEYFKKLVGTIGAPRRPNVI